MYPTNDFIIQKSDKVSDGIGGYTEVWKKFKSVQGYLDLITGTNLNTSQSAITEDSTHILVIPTYVSGVTDKMRVIAENRSYSINYVDDPLGVHHHLEIYLTFGGEINGG